MRTYRSAIYLRLSKEEAGKQESSSIAGQRALLHAYVSDHPELKIIKEYTDDGYTGANFDRPGFRQMMDDAASGNIDCILVKDLSRLGRNYIEAGRYIERTFPLMGIRFIAVNDGYDSLRDNESDQFLIPFRNLVNDAYCRDLSLKIRSQLAIKRKNGECLSSYAVYGYIKDPGDKHKIIIDPYAAEVVRTIFDLKLGGMTDNNIAKRLDRLSLPPPAEYKRRLIGNYHSGFQTTEDNAWSRTAITRILTDETYTGTLVQGKFRKVNHRLAQCVMLDKKEWVRIPDNHEPIIPRDEFDLVQSLMKRDYRKPKGQEYALAFSGYVHCGICGRNMSRMNSGMMDINYYRCQSVRLGEPCGMRLLREDKLISSFCTAVSELRESIGKALEAIGKEKEAAQLVRDSIIAELNKEITRLEDIRHNLHRDFKDGVVTREEFMNLSGRYSERIDEKKRKLNALENEGETSAFSKWMEKIAKYNDGTEINHRLVAFLVEEIVVHDRDNVEVRFRFAEQTHRLLELAERKNASQSIDRADYVEG